MPSPSPRLAASPSNSPLPPNEYSIAERPAQDGSPDNERRGYTNGDAHSRTPSRSRRQSKARSRSRSRSRGSGAEEVTWDRPKELNYKPALILKGHKRAISSVQFSPDGKRIASCSADGTIKIWDAETGKLEHTLEGHMAGISCIAWSPDSNVLASGSDDKAIRLWDVTKGKAHPTPFLGHDNYIYSLAFAPKGNMLVSGSYDEAVFLWDVRSRRNMRSLPAHSDPVSGVDFVRDGTLIVSCSSDGLIRIWDTATGQCLRTLIHEDNAPVVGVRFSPNGKFVLAWTLDSSIRLWNYVEGRCVKTYQGHRNEKYSLGGGFGVYGPAGGPFSFITTGSEDGSIWMWDVGTKTVLQRIDAAHEGVVFSVDAHPSRPWLVSGGADRTVRVWRHDAEVRREGE